MDSTIEFDLRVVCAGYLDELFRELVDVYVPIGNRPGDIYVCLEMCLEKLDHGTAMEMLLGISVRFLKQHFSMLRHSKCTFAHIHIIKAHDRLLKLLQALTDIRKYLDVPIKKAIDMAVRLYREYTQVCQKHHIQIPIDEKWLNIVDVCLPHDQNMSWYRSKKLIKDLKEKYQVSFTRGKYAGMWCDIIRVNGNNTCCQFANGEKHYIHSDIPLIHRPKPSSDIK